MFIVVNDKNDKTYSIYKFLREGAPDANIDTLKQISIYVASCIKNEEFQISENYKLIYDEINCCYIFNLDDNRKIIFSNNSSEFGFKIIRFDLATKLIMTSNVSLRVFGDLTTLNVYSEIVSNSFGLYVVTFRPNDMSDDSIKFGTINYYTLDEVDWVYEISNKDNIDTDFDLVSKENGIYPFSDKSFFDLSLEYTNTHFDCYDGCLKNYLERVDLLFNNIMVYTNTDVKKKQRKL